MSDTPPFAEFMGRIRAGDARAAEDLVRQYESAIRLAVRTRLTDPALRRQLDSVDICQSVLASFFARAALGQYDLADPAQLVGLLVRMAHNKLAGQARFHRRLRRDGGRAAGLDGADGQADAGPAPSGWRPAATCWRRCGRG
jgi:RNA polymerase sigma-70 factor (ECF subfamily)